LIFRGQSAEGDIVLRPGWKRQIRIATVQASAIWKNTSGRKRAFKAKPQHVLHRRLQAE